jgi:hypothetical protein
VVGINLYSIRGVQRRHGVASAPIDLIERQALGRRQTRGLGAFIVEAPCATRLSQVFAKYLAPPPAATLLCLQRRRGRIAWVD